MQYENFQKVKSIVEQIDKDKQTLENLNSNNISVKVLDNLWTVLSVGSWSSCEHDCKNYAARFVNDLKFHYEEKLRKLNAELETL
jgi:hypothetical protein